MNHPEKFSEAEGAVKNLMKLTLEEKEQRRLKPRGSFRGRAEITSAVITITSGDRTIVFRDDCLILLRGNRFSGSEEAVFLTNEKKFNKLWDFLEKMI